MSALLLLAALQALGGAAPGEAASGAGHPAPQAHVERTLPRTSPIRPGPVALSLISRRGLPAQDAPAPTDAWLGPDKARHFFLSFAATALAHGALRAAGLDGGVALAGAAGIAVGAGAWKELRDRRVPGETASLRDGAWDLLGVAAAVALLSGI